MSSDNAFLFDLDGVLIDSETVYTQIWEEIDRLYPTGKFNFAQAIKGCTLEFILSQYFPDPEIRHKAEMKLYELEACIEYQFTPGAVQLLENLKAMGIKTALVTSSNNLKMKHLYAQHPAFKQYFDFIVTGDMVRNSKPDPEGYALAADTLNVPYQNCIVVEDSLQGVKAGEALGGKVIGISGTLPADTISPHCDFVTSTLMDITPALIRSLTESE